MPLIQLWEKTPDIVLQYNIKQIVSAAGDGILADESECSKELRHYLRNIPVDKLFEHLEYCLTNTFERSGYALQDIINEFGRRLDYEVEDGRYQGRQNSVGNDGLWKAPDGLSIIVEIKTTDAYRINLDTIATYRTKLINAGKITNNSSILIVVGRSDTGDLEAQIRGSRHAWDARIISTDALAKLVELKIKSDEDETTEKIRGSLFLLSIRASTISSMLSSRLLGTSSRAPKRICRLLRALRKSIARLGTRKNIRRRQCLNEYVPTPSKRSASARL